MMPGNTAGRRLHGAGRGHAGRVQQVQPGTLQWQPKWLAEASRLQPLRPGLFVPRGSDQWSEASSQPSRAWADFEDKVREKIGAKGPEERIGKPLEDVHTDYLELIAAKVELAQENLPMHLCSRLQNSLLKKRAKTGEVSARYQLDAFLEEEVADVAARLGPPVELLFGPEHLPAGTIIEITVNSAALLMKFLQLERVLLLCRDAEPSHLCVVADRTPPDCSIGDLLVLFPRLNHLAEQWRLTVVHWSQTVPIERYQRDIAEKDKELAQKDEVIAEVIAQKDEVIAEVIAQKDEELAQKERELAQKDEVIAALLARVEQSSGQRKDEQRRH